MPTLRRHRLLYGLNIIGAIVEDALDWRWPSRPQSFVVPRGKEQIGVRSIKNGRSR